MLFWIILQKRVFFLISFFWIAKLMTWYKTKIFIDKIILRTLIGSTANSCKIYLWNKTDVATATTSFADGATPPDCRTTSTKTTTIAAVIVKNVNLTTTARERPKQQQWRFINNHGCDKNQQSSAVYALHWNALVPHTRSSRKSLLHGSRYHENHWSGGVQWSWL